MLLQLAFGSRPTRHGESFPHSGAGTGKALLLASAAGLAAGAATLVRPSWILFTPIAAVVIVLLNHARLKHAGMGLAMLAAMTLVLAPWWARNARLTGHFTPTTLQVGASLYDGLSPYATGASDMKPAEAIQQQFWQDHAGSRGVAGTLGIHPRPAAARRSVGLGGETSRRGDPPGRGQVPADLEPLAE